MDTPVAIEIKELIKDFRTGFRGVKLRAVDNLSLNIPAGSIYGLLGPNGSGKSTTLKMVLGLLAPTAGTCSIFGVAAGSAEARARIGFLPEAPYFYRHLSGRELVKFYGRVAGIGPKKLVGAVEEALQIVGMTEAADRRVGTYSKGMLQRIGLAQAVVHDPQLVILDEPTAGVDPIGAAAIGDILLAMKKRGKTVVLCSHLLGQVEELCDRVAIMNRGKLILEGSVDSVLTKQEQHTLIVENFTEGARESVATALAASGARLVAITHPRVSLEKFFLEHLSVPSAKKEEE